MLKQRCSKTRHLLFLNFQPDVNHVKGKGYFKINAFLNKPEFIKKYCLISTKMLSKEIQGKRWA